MQRVQLIKQNRIRFKEREMGKQNTKQNVTLFRVELSTSLNGLGCAELPTKGISICGGHGPSK